MPAPASIDSITLHQVDTERILNFHVDQPGRGDQSAGHALVTSGWVVASGQQIEAVEMARRGEIMTSAPIEVDRPDVRDRHPDLPDGPHGWQTQVSLVGLPEDFEIFVRAVLADGSRESLATIRGHRRPLLEPDESDLDPLIVSTYGRTGSTWLMRLFDQHPSMLAYRPFEYEPRAISYWIAVLGALAEPSSYLQPLATNITSDHWWLGEASVPTELAPPDPPVEDQLAQVGIEDVATLCRNRIREFYGAVKIAQKKPEARYFVEKAPPSPALWRLVLELFPSAREVILVRDFRDMACSILAYNAKMGITSFGRERYDSDYEFLDGLRASAESLLSRYKFRRDDAFLLRYEDLIVEPEQTLTKLFDSLGIASSSDVVASVLDRALADTGAMAQHRTAKDPRASVGRWQEDMSPELRERCAEVLDDVLVEFGYDPTSRAIA